jgi:mono/diheme cytochrome c family protein
MSCLIVLGILGTAAAQAQDIAAGHAIAESWCSNCHSIAAKDATARNEVPSFFSIAQMTSTTEMSLAAFLTTPHAAGMPNFNLSRGEIRDISAYILSLRQK